MFRIRNDQMEAFSRSLEEAFVKRMVGHLRDNFPEELAARGLQETALPLLVRRGMIDAKKYGVINERDLERYIECLVILGPEFDVDPRIPWAGEILRRPGLDGEAKMDGIEEHLIFDTDGST